jgi:predicted transcriptional regulator of viral defense system
MVYFDKRSAMKKTLSPSNSQQILDFLRYHQGFINTKELLQKGFHHIYLRKLQNQGKIIKVKRGLYKLSNIHPSSELPEIARIIPDGVVCLGSALSYHNLGTYEPKIYHIAVLKDRKIKLPAMPPIRLHHFSEKQCSTGIEKALIDGFPVLIYNKEKTICDLIRLRKSIGIDLMKEAIEEYLKRSDKDIQKLMEYSKTLHIFGLVKKYFEVLL